MTSLSGVRLYTWQRLSAAIMAPLVVLHLGTILYAVNAGLSAAEILARTQGSVFWGAIYSVFVLAAAIHAAIGLRTILVEWARLRPVSAGWVSAGFALVLLVLGLRAVGAVVLS